ncbi:MAG: hypothetical protein PHI18_08585, partial [bacterium]|nr:hypothetical protein [bacterium]
GAAAPASRCSAFRRRRDAESADLRMGRIWRFAAATQLFCDQRRKNVSCRKFHPLTIKKHLRAQQIALGIAMASNKPVPDYKPGVYRM